MESSSDLCTRGCKNNNYTETNPPPTSARGGWVINITLNTAALSETSVQVTQL